MRSLRLTGAGNFADFPGLNGKLLACSLRIAHFLNGREMVSKQFVRKFYNICTRHVLSIHQIGRYASALTNTFTTYAYPPNFKFKDPMGGLQRGTRSGRQKRRPMQAESTFLFARDKLVSTKLLHRRFH